jgi:hypothetical protein
VTKIDKSKILQVLRQRGLDARADWVDREFSDRVDTVQNASLFGTLGINAAELADAEPADMPEDKVLGRIVLPDTTPRRDRQPVE